MSEAWGIALVTIFSTFGLAVLGFGVKALWMIAKTFKEFVPRNDCNNAMGEHCKEINILQKGFNNNRTAIRQIILAIKQLHGVDIHYEE